jgi:hypothetical protein
MAGPLLRSVRGWSKARGSAPDVQIPLPAPPG